MARLMIVEDDPQIGQTLQRSLQLHHHQTTWVQNGSAALLQATRQQFDLILLDLGLPDLDGFDVCRQLRGRQPDCVLVILTSSDQEIDVVVGLEAGADDFLSKPFRLNELLARIRAHLRRDAGNRGTSTVRVLRIGDLEIDPAARTVRLAQAEIAFSTKEFDVLARLAAEPDIAVSKTDLMTDVWGENWYGSSKTLDVHLSIVRRKLATTARELGIAPPMIVTVRGWGYRLQAPMG
jgi:DNA-binding response OmpR family regulator